MTLQVLEITYGSMDKAAVAVAVGLVKIEAVDWCTYPEWFRSLVQFRILRSLYSDRLNTAGITPDVLYAMYLSREPV